MNKIKDI